MEEKLTKEDYEDIQKALASVESVNHPNHYNTGNIEVIDFIEDQQLGFCLGNAIKYIARAGKKDPNKYVEDLKKAKWYLEREIYSKGKEGQCFFANN